MIRTSPNWNFYRTQSRISLFVCVLVLGFLTACNQDAISVFAEPTSTIAVTITPSSTPTNTNTPTETPPLTPTHTSTPSSTPTNTPTQMPTFTPSPTPRFVSVIVDEAQIYSGPGKAYNLLAFYSEDINVYAVGRREDNSWVIILLPDCQGWVAAENINVEFDLETLPVVAVPPTPVPSLTPTPAPKVSVFLRDASEQYNEGNLAGKVNLHISVEGLPPGESYTLTIYFENGDIYRTIPGKVSPSGNINGILLSHSKLEEMSDGSYTIFIRGELGTILYGSFKLPME